MFKKINKVVTVLELTKISYIKYWLFILAFIQLFLQVSQLFFGEEYIVSFLTNDDTYYYLQTAWNTKRLGFVTFDGLHTTNGVQFAWFIFLLLLTFIVRSKIELLFATLLACFILNAISHFVIWRITKETQEPVFALIAASFWVLVSLRGYSSGLENSLHSFIFWCVLWQTLIFINRLARQEQPNLFNLTLVLILNAWVRLDAAIYSALIYSICLLLIISHHSFRAFIREKLKAILFSISLASMGFIIQIMAFYLMGKSLLPVSALIKSSGSGFGWKSTSIDNILNALTYSVPPVYPYRFPIIFIQLACLLVFFLFIGLLFTNKFSVQRNLEQLDKLWLIVFIGFLAYHFVVIFFNINYIDYYVWYRSPQYIFWVVTFSIIAMKLIYILNGFLNLQVYRVAYTLSFLIILISSIWFVFNINRHLSNNTSFHYLRYRVALDLSKNTNPDAVFAAWNAGELSFFSNRKFINLDGLINSIDYYEDVLNGPKSIIDYLYENEVDYVVDYVNNDVTSSLPIEKSYPVHSSGHWLRVWRLP
jgi:hypothetical protein